MKYIAVIIGLVLCIPALGCITGPETQPEHDIEHDDTKVSTMKNLSNKTILMVIAPSNFRDEELFVPKGLFEKNGATVVIASKNTGTAKGMLGGTASVDISVSAVDVNDYDAVVFIGGSGVDSHRLYEDQGYLKLAADADAAGKIIGAICLGPMIPAGAGLLSGRNVTVFISGVSYIEEKGANYTGAPVTMDGGIITAEGPNAAEEFAQMITEALST